jgi:DNA polymerase III alpha subunit
MLLKITSIKPIGNLDTYNISVDHPEHNFILGNGIVSGNSHSMSYALTAYKEAWYKTFYPAAFYYGKIKTANAKGAKATDFLRDLYYESGSLGVRILKPSIDSQNEVSIINEKTLLLGLDIIKGIRLENVKELLPLAKKHNNFIKFIIDILPNRIPKDVILCIECGVFDVLFGNNQYSLRKTAIEIVEYINKLTAGQKKALKELYDFDMSLSKNIRRVAELCQRTKFNYDNLKQLEISLTLKTPSFSAASSEFDKTGMVFTPISINPLCRINPKKNMTTNAMVVKIKNKRMLLIDHSAIINAKIDNEDDNIQIGNIITCNISGKHGFLRCKVIDG